MMKYYWIEFNPEFHKKFIKRGFVSKILIIKYIKTRLRFPLGIHPDIIFILVNIEQILYSNLITLLKSLNLRILRFQKQ